jgi:hypothetical protein
VVAIFLTLEVRQDALETFAPPRPLADHADFRRHRQRCLAGLSDAMVDTPIISIIKQFNALPFCFTLQCCYGHFVLPGERNHRTLDSLPALGTDTDVLYRIAYVAFCIENGRRGRRLLTDLQSIVGIDPPNIQFGSADWFWERQVNSFVLQVEPERFRFKDSVMLAYAEALHIEKTRNAFFARLDAILQRVAAVSSDFDE